MRVFHASQQWATMSSQAVKIRLDSQLSRMNCQTFSLTLSSGHLAGRGSRVMLGGTSSPAGEMPARLIQQQHGMATGADHGGDLGQVQAHPPGCCTKAAPLPSCGQTAPKMQVDAVRWSCGATGLVPHHAMDRGGGTALDDLQQRRAVGVSQKRYRAGGLRSRSPSGPSALNRTPPSRTICSVTLPNQAASLRPPS